MHHESARAMLFYFLQTRDYNQDSGKLSFDMGYDLGDYSPESAHFNEIASDCAQLLRTRLNGVFNDEGEIIKRRSSRDNFGEFDRSHEEYKKLEQELKAATVLK